MLSDTIRNAGGKRNDRGNFELEINEFDLETWAHEAECLEAELDKCVKFFEGDDSGMARLEAESAELREEVKRLGELVDECDGWSGSLGA